MRRISNIFTAAALAAGMAAAANRGMPAAQQTALVAKYCAVCHNDAHVNGGLTLEHFDALSPDPSVVAMLVSKLRDGGAISAAGLPRPDQATQDALLAALLTEAAGAEQWTVTKSDPAALTASIFREVPVPPNTPKRFAGDIGAPDRYRLTVACRADIRVGEIVVAWAPGAAPKDSVLSAAVDGKPPVTYTVEGSEKRFKGTLGTMGTGATILSSQNLPQETLTINNLFQDGSVTFSFTDLPQTARQALTVCFSDR